MNYQPLRSLVPMLALAAASVPLMAQTATEAPVLRVQGAAEVRVVPDLAVVRLGVANEAQTAQEAQQAVNSASDAILDAVRRVGIDEQNVQTVRLVLSPLYSSRRPGDTQEPRIVGYRASNTVSVRVDDLNLVAAVIDAALAAGANQLEGVSFGLQDDQAVRQQALRRAVDEARGKADAMAAALGVELAGIISVTEEPGFVREPMMEMSRVMAVQSAPQTTVSPGEVAVSASVSIEYRLSEQ
ncbi:MAG: hypothetical protein CL477_09565 [Acidobacteria bacterium]|jgi:hypothetical protein|nr:hypothetical protein [Acidobacteriota bacterium]MDP7480948.1 SIMPL domain-containing protein [Vicinamibacterales bacterium]HJN44409.1 SIMPL domain-containing protein [Vicinamibacterales bacterium]